VSQLPEAFHSPVDFIGVSSVLDDAYNQQLTALCLDKWQLMPQFAHTAPASLGIDCGYTDPRLLGIDRWLNVLAVAGRQPVCVVSCGTALTLDVVEANRHLGGYILPGLSLQLASLVQGTQRVRPQEQASTSLDFGKNTSEAVYHGILLSCVASIERVYQAVQKNSKRQVQLILTGGDAEKIGLHLQCQHDIIPELLLLGLQRYFGHSS
jgi:type III pantothenate kinase